MRIIWARHAPSMHNLSLTSWKEVPNRDMPLADPRRPLAKQLGVKLGAQFLRDAQLCCSPFLRAIQSLGGVLMGAGLLAEGTPDGDFGQWPVHIDERVAEMNFGGEDWTLDLYREPGGIYKHVFASGKSFCKDAIGDMRSYIQELRSEIITDPRDRFIMCHGWTCLLAVMAWFNLGDEVFDALENLGNCEYLTIAPVTELEDNEALLFQADGWGVTGLRYRTTLP